MGNNFYYLDGDKNLLEDSSFKLGVVGSRSIIKYTKNVLEDLFQELKNFDFCIVSGGMYGVDIFSHNLALENNLKTIIVLPQGITSYKNSILYRQLNLKSNSKFLFVSEYPDNFAPRKYTYIERNKVISCLSEVLLVAQASYKSGSISTAYSTLKQNKKLISVPFSLDNIQFQGTNLLIEKGSKIYLNASSVLSEFNLSDNIVEFQIKDSLSIGSKNIDELQNIIGVNFNLLQKGILKLILEGQIFYDGEKYYL
jgi:DNA processing protein